MSAPGGGGENFDFCEYVYNPLMRQYQAMMRLMQTLRDSQSSDCNDIQCFNNENDPSNPLTSLNSSASDASFFTTFGPMMALWAVLVLGLFLFRPNSMRGSSSQSAETAKTNRSPNRNMNNHFRREDDDDHAPIS
jgi:hypothetical protein